MAVHSVDTLFYRTFCEKVSDELQGLEAAVTLGQGITSFDDYRYRVGRIKALRQALDLAKQVNDAIHGVRSE